MPPKARPLERFATAVAGCSKEAALYGKCIAADYNNISKDKCLTEFRMLEKCYTKAYKQK